ncbi:MAG: Rv3235 family protein [Nocardioides sp.]
MTAVPLDQSAYAVQGTLALPLGLLPPPLIWPAESHDPRNTFGPKPEADVTHVATVTRAKLEAWTRRFAQAVVEIVGGDRPAAQVLRWTTPRVYDDICRRAQLVTHAASRRPAGQRGPRQLTVPHQIDGSRQGDGPRQGDGSRQVDAPPRARRVSVRPIVQSVRISFITGSVVEATIRVRHGERSRAIAARFEVLGDRWQCSALEFA